MKCLALDIGSSSIKGAVIDVMSGELGHVTARPFPARVQDLPALHFEVDPHAIEGAAREVLEALAAVAPDAERLYIAGQMGGVLLLDPQGQPLTNYLSWRDQRSQAGTGREPSFVQRIREQLDDDTFHSLGRELQAGSTLTLLYWLGQTQGLPSGATPVTVADYVISRLCRSPGQMHVTHAIGLLDLRTLDWHHEVFELLGIGQLAWPRLVRSFEPVRTCRIGQQELAVYGAFGDQQCALFGAELERGELSINISTGSQVSRRAERLQPGEYQTRAYFGGDLLQTITHLPAGRSLNVLMELLTELARAEGLEPRDPWGTITRLADAADQAASEGAANELAVDLSFFAAPSGSAGSITGITTENLTAGGLFKAAFRFMAENYARCAARLDPAESWSRVALSGSLPRSVPALRRALQQQFSAPLRDAACEEETLLGLLKLATESGPELKESTREAVSGVEHVRPANC